jgi:two-component system sensor histidine kinase/response regulator
MPRVFDAEFATGPIGHHTTPRIDLARWTGPLPEPVLVADDSTELRRLLQLQLETWGISARGAERGDEALAELQKNSASYSAALLDWQMPGKSGLEVATALRLAGTKLPLAAITASALDEERAACLAAGFDEVFTKPIDFARLRRWLSEVAVSPTAPPEVAPQHSAVPPHTPAPGGIANLKSRMAAALPAQIEQLRHSSIHSQDTFERDLHRLLGTVGSYGFSAVHAALGALEACIRDGSDPTRAWHDLEHNVQQAARAAETNAQPTKEPA